MDEKQKKTDNPFVFKVANVVVQATGSFSLPPPKEEDNKKK